MVHPDSLSELCRPRLQRLTSNTLELIHSLSAAHSHCLTWPMLRRPVPGLADALAALGESRPYIQALAQRGSEHLAQELTVLKHRYNALEQENVRALHPADACKPHCWC